MICKQLYWTILLSVWIVAVLVVWQKGQEYEIAQNGLNLASTSNSTPYTLKTKLGAFPLQIEGIAWKTQIAKYPILVKIAFCESGLNPNAYSWDGGAQARGLFQITRRYWPDITDEQAFDPDWSLNWAIEKMKAGQLHLWTCWKNQFKDYQ